MDVDNLDSFVITVLKDIILPVLVAIIASVLAVRRSFVQARIDLQREYDNRFNTKRWEIYLSMVEITREIFAKKQLRGDDSVNLRNKIELLKTQILLIGSHQVVTAFTIWLKYREDFGDLHEYTLDKFHTLVTEMRKDLGLQTNQPELDVMLGLFL